MDHQLTGSGKRPCSPTKNWTGHGTGAHDVGSYPRFSVPGSSWRHYYGVSRKQRDLGKLAIWEALHPGEGSEKPALGVWGMCICLG